MGAMDKLKQNSAPIAELCQRYGVKRLRVFRSAVTDEWSEKRSDYDFLVEYGPLYQSRSPLDRLVGLQLALEDLLGRKVDVVNEHTIRNITFKQSAELHSRELYAA